MIAVQQYELKSKLKWVNKGDEILSTIYSTTQHKRQKSRFRYNYYWFYGIKVKI